LAADGKNGIAVLRIEGAASCSPCPDFATPILENRAWWKKARYRSLLIDGNPIDNIKLIEDPARNFIVIMKDGKIHKNLLAGKSGE
jgi:hypothetical protein